MEHSKTGELNANSYYSCLMALKEDQIIALAPDASAAKSGKELAVLSKWQLRGASEKALWGHCHGSGKLPYQTQVDLINIAFKCSCPSRKFPCKHGIGLLLLYSREPGSFSKGEEPEWVSDWLNKRTEKIVKKTEQESKPVDAEAQSKRIEARARKVLGGIDDLQIWLKDLIRNGLLNLPERAYEYWQNPVKRMVDAQATGLASLLKGLGNINYFNDSWKAEVLNQLTRIYQVTEAYKQIDFLPEDLAREVRNQVGFTQSKEELMSQPAIVDEWLVLARTLEDDEQLVIERNWLYGMKSKRFALILQFFVNRQVPEFSLLPGTSVQAELVFYKGVLPHRALIKQQHKADAFYTPEGHSSITEAFEKFSEVILQNPFHYRIPQLIQNVRFIRDNSQHFLMDANNNVIKVRTTDAIAIKLLAVTGGKPCMAFVMMNGELAEPMAVWMNEKFITLAQ